MSNMLSKLIALPDFKVGPVYEKISKDGIKYTELDLIYEGPVPDICPDCGGKMYSHGNRKLTVTDTPFLGHPSKLTMNIPRRRCKDCQMIWRPEIRDVDEKHLMTTRAFTDIAQKSLKQTFASVADEYMLAQNTIKNAFTDFIKEKEDTLRFKTPAFLGIDEIKIKKLGEVTVITDLEHRTLYDMTLGRNQASLTEYFSRLPDADKVLWVCSDMYRPFEKSISDALPNARWVIDRFHLVAYANRAMDEVRKTVQKGMTKKNRNRTKKGLAYTMRTRLKNLTPGEAMKIRSCRNDPVLAPLATEFDLKEDFFNIYDENLVSKENAQQAFAEWERSIPSEAMYDDFRKLAGTVHNFYEQIFNFWDCPISITNGFTECSNRIIRENNVKGRGHSFEILRGRTLYRRSNIDSMLKNGTASIGPSIPAKGPVFHFEETKKASVDEDDTFDGIILDDPLMGLVPGVDFDPETGEIFEDVDDYEDDTYASEDE